MRIGSTHAHRTEQRELFRSGKLKCLTCTEIKLVEEFGPIGPGKNLPRQPCKPCYSVKQKNSYYGRNGVDRVYRDLLKRAYGLTMEQYQAMVADQDGRCAICRQVPVKRRSKSRVRLQVDHNHKTGAVRELLCSRCNRLVWALEDHHGLMDATLAYLGKHNGPLLMPENRYSQAPESVLPQGFRPFDPGEMTSDRAQSAGFGWAVKMEIFPQPRIGTG